MSFYENVFVNVGIMIIIAQGVYVLTGLTGLFSLGQSSFVAVGAYTAGMLATRYGLNPYLCVLAGMAAAVVVSFIIGLPSLRLRHVYFSLATIAYCYALQSVLTVSQYFGGSIGLVGIPTLTRWWHVLGAMALTVFVVRNFKLSRFGLACLSVRTDEVAAQTYGIKVFATKQMAFSLASAISGLAGGLLAFNLGYLSPDMFSVPISSEYLIMVFFGGLYSQTGAVAGTAVLTLLMELLRTAAAWRMIAYSTIILIVILLRPMGLFGTWELSARGLARLGQSGHFMLFGPGGPNGLTGPAKSASPRSRNTKDEVRHDG
ncbi:MAG: branched-chain amino acid ABC transporter permease [Bacillota bacterium]|jgi:branched-chain amino acid transport system permease protein